MSLTAVSGTNKPVLPFFNKIIKAGCDLPEQGGIGGNIKKEDKPLSPYALEERPVITARTGERVYLDKWIEQHTKDCICSAKEPRFSTTA